MSTEPQNLNEAVYQAIGHASMCWVGGTGALVFDSTEAAIVGANLIEWIEKWYRNEQPSYLPSGMDEFASNKRAMGKRTHDPMCRCADPSWTNPVHCDCERVVNIRADERRGMDFAGIVHRDLIEAGVRERIAQEIEAVALHGYDTALEAYQQCARIASGGAQ
jgi:hypothetical protein